MNTRRHASASGHICKLLRNGEVSVSLDALERDLGVSRTAVRAAMRRLADKGLAYMASRGFYVLVPDEYKDAGTPPAVSFLDDLMRYRGHSYYVALASAVEVLLGAHDVPRSVQVITDRATDDLTYGSGNHVIQFFTKSRIRTVGRNEDLSGLGIARRTVGTGPGSILVSTPEQTALDLVRYLWCRKIHVDVAYVLKRLAPLLDNQRLADAFTGRDIVTWRRVGCLLDILGYRAKTAKLRRAVMPHVWDTDWSFPGLLNEKVARRRKDWNHEWYLYVNIVPDELNSSLDDIEKRRQGVGLPIVRKRQGSSQGTKKK